MLGISAYLKDFSATYLKQAADAGIQAVFTSLHLPEETPQEFTTGLAQFRQSVHRYDLDVMVDVSRETFKKLGLAQGDFSELAAQGFHTLRLDAGFDEPQLIKQLQATFKVVLNASTIDENFLVRLQRAKVDFSQLIAAHNFYPKPETGLTSAYFQAKNRLFKAWGLQTLAFIPGDGLKRYPFYAGLPTLELQRGWNSYTAYLEMTQRYGVQQVYIGDSQLSPQSLAWIQRFNQEHVVTLPIADADLSQLPQQPLAIRAEESPQLIRVQTKRQPQAIKQTLARPKGTVTCENNLAKRYAGEVEIAKADLPFSPTSNYLGTIPAPYQAILPLLTGKQRVQFVAV